MAGSLSELQGTLTAAAQGGVLVLKKGLGGTGDMDAFLDALPTRQVQLTQPQIILSGPDFPQTLAVNGTVADHWYIPGIAGSGLAVSGLHLVYTQTTAGAVITATLTVAGSLAVGAQTIALSGSLGSGGLLQFDRADQQALAVPVLDLGNLATSGRFAPYLPPNLPLFAAVPLSDFGLAMGYVGGPLATLSASLDTGTNWELVPGAVTLTGVGVTLQTNFATQGGGFIRQRFGANIHAGFALGGNPYQVDLAMSSGSQWVFSLLPGDGNLLPALADLAGLAGGASLQQTVQDGLKAVGLDALSLDAVRVGCDIQSHKLNFVQVAGHLTLAGTRIDMLMHLPNFQFNGQLARGATISLKALAQHFFSAADALPEIDITQLSLVTNPGQGYYAVSCTVADSSFQLGPLALTAVQFDVEKQPSGFSGGVSADLALAGTGINLAAQAPSTGGWDFSGSTAQGQALKVGDLITDIGARFGVNNLPSALDDFILQDIAFDYNTQDRAFSFTCAGQFTMAERAVDLQVTLAIDARTDGPGYQGSASGTLTIGHAVFAVSFSADAQRKVLTASWSDATNPLGFDRIAEVFGFAIPPIPQGLDLGLIAVDFSYDFTSATLVLTAHSANYGQAAAAFVSYVATGGRLHAFSFAINVPINLSSLPLVGSKLSGAETVGFTDLQVLIASTALDAAAAGQVNTFIKGADPQAAAVLVPAAGADKGITLVAPLSIGGKTLPLALGLAGNTPATTTAVATGASGVAAPATTPADPTKWFDIQKSFGPVTFQRIGVKYQDAQIYVLLDASLSFSGLTLALYGLSVSSPFTNFSPSFHLDGIGVDLNEGPINIGGGLLALPASALGAASFQYDGELTIQAENFGLIGIGSYAELNGNPSLFVFVQYSEPIGGPPCFFITGLSGGFGYNRSLRIPTIDQVYQFPLVKALDDPSVIGGAGATPMGVLAVLEGRGASGPTTPWVTDALGEDWVAAGISFTSFELVQSRVLLVAEFGSSFSLTMLGLSTMRLPQAGDLIFAYAELGLEATFQPDAGFFGISAVLSPNSYVLDPACHLTGGFAFYMWFGGDHEGDFVVTLGGYHPAFTPPTWYPTVPRLGFHWPVNDLVTIKGESYFALTPSAVMGGGSLEVLFHDGDLRAWFDAYADFLVSWKPFYYQAGIGVSVGASYRLNLLFTTVTVSIDVGAALKVWGPPTAGRVYVDWYIISFSVGFGADSSPQTPVLDWPGFKTLLPADSHICKVIASQGLAGKTADGTWIVRADAFQFATESAIPANNLLLQTAQVNTFQASGQSLDIRPMALQNLSSDHTVAVTRSDGSVVDMQAAGWSLTARTRNVPEALWGVPVSGDPSPSAKTLPGRLVGVSAATPVGETGSSPGVIDMAKNLSYEPVMPNGLLSLSPAAVPTAAPVQDVGTVKAIATTLMAPAAVQQRTAIYTALQGLGYDPGSNGTLDQLAAAAGTIFRDAPMRTA